MVMAAELDYRVVVHEGASEREADLLTRYWAPGDVSRGFLYDISSLKQAFPEFAGNGPKLAIPDSGHIVYLDSSCKECRGHKLFFSRGHYLSGRGRVRRASQEGRFICQACLHKGLLARDQRETDSVLKAKQQFADRRAVGCDFATLGRRQLMSLAGLLHHGVTQHKYGINIDGAAVDLGLPCPDFESLLQTTALTIDPENVRANGLHIHADGAIGLQRHVRYVLNDWSGRDTTITQAFLDATLSGLDADLVSMWRACCSIDAFSFLLHEAEPLRVYPGKAAIAPLRVVIDSFAGNVSLSVMKSAIMMALQEAASEARANDTGGLKIVSMASIEEHGEIAGCGHFAEAAKLPDRLKHILYKHCNGTVTVVHEAASGRYKVRPMIDLFGVFFGLDEHTSPEDLG